MSKLTIKEGLLLSFIPFFILCVVSEIYLFIPISNKLETIYNVSSAQINLLSSLFSFCYAFGLLLWGWLASRVDKRILLLIGTALLAFITLGLAFTENYNMALALRCLQGVAASSFPPLVIMWFIEQLPSRALIGVTIMSFALVASGGIGQKIAMLSVHESVTGLMLGLSLSYFAALVFLFVFKAPKEKMKFQRKPSIKFSDIFGNKRLLRAYVTGPFVLGSFVSFHMVIINYYPDMINQLSNLSTIESICFICTLGAGFVIRRFGVTGALGFVLTFAGIFILLSTIMLQKNTVWFLLPQGIYTAFLGMIAPAMISYVTSISAGRTLITSIYMFLLFMGASAGSFMPIYTGPSILYIQAFMLFLMGRVFWSKRDEI